MPECTSKVSIDSFTDRSLLKLGSKIDRSFDWNWNLRVPKVTESYERNGSKLSYCLQVTVIVSYAKNVLVELPFTIVPGEPVENKQARRDAYYESRGVQAETTQAHTTSMPDPMMTVAQPEAYSSWRQDSPSSCRYSNSSSCNDN